MKIMTWVLAPIAIPVTIFLPAGVTFYFALAALLGAAQNTLTMQPWFRRWYGLTLLPPPPVETYQAPANASSFAILKDRFGQVVKDAKSKQGGMVQRMEARAEADRKLKAQQKRNDEAWQDIQKRINRRKQ
jgi:membrane protein insertase Oxa1/YidC/SpoIIIJ